MTKNPYLAGLVAGGVAALLYLSLATGSAIGLLLFYLAPLPGFIAGFGWGIRAALVAALGGTFIILANLGITPALAYAASLAIPSVLISHYTFLSRLIEPTGAEKTADEEPEIEWYPVGNLLLILALYGGALSMVAILLLGFSYEAYLEKIASELDLIVSKAKEIGLKLEPEHMERFKKTVQTLLPGSTAILWCLLTLINMWVAAHIVRLSELLKRPWPDFTRIEFPQITSFVLIGVMVLAVIVPGLVGLVLSGFAGALMMAFLMLGLAVVHYLTRPYPSRGLILFGTYVAVFFIGWGAIVLIVLGIIEPLAQFRRRAKDAPS